MDVRYVLKNIPTSTEESIKQLSADGSLRPRPCFRINLCNKALDPFDVKMLRPSFGDAPL